MQEEEVRRRILDDHVVLRGLLDEIEPLALEFERGGSAQGERLRDEALRLYERFAAHLDLEDRLLAPALRAAGAEGKRHAERLGHEHREQRELLRYLIGRLSQDRAPTTLVAREVHHFVNLIRLDMEHEEKTLLTPEVLAAQPR
jgi:hemerythrin-like domain-containing protein